MYAYLPVEPIDIVQLNGVFRSVQHLVPAVFDGKIGYQLIVDGRLAVNEKIVLPHRVWIDVQFSGYVVDDRLGEKHSLRCAKPSKSRIGRQIRSAQIS